MGFMTRQCLQDTLAHDLGTIELAESLRSQLESTYAEDAFRALPRLALVDIGLWLCQAHNLQYNASKVVTCAIEVLRDLGFFVAIDEERQLTVNRAHCHLEIAAVDASMHAASACDYEGDDGLCQQFRKLAKDLYRTLYAELRGFHVRYDGD